MTALALQLLQMVLVLAAAPLLTGVVRKVKARLVGRRGPSPLQPYRDLLRLLRKDRRHGGNQKPMAFLCREASDHAQHPRPGAVRLGRLPFKGIHRLEAAWRRNDADLL